jgi:hypothetical protein
MDVLKNHKCYEITVEDPSYEFESMRDAYDIKLLLKNGFFSIFKEQLEDFSRDVISSDNYEEFKLTTGEIKKVQQKLKLTKSRVRIKL